jgi:hypothetical protein
MFESTVVPMSTGCELSRSNDNDAWEDVGVDDSEDLLSVHTNDGKDLP